MSKSKKNKVEVKIVYNPELVKKILEPENELLSDEYESDEKVNSEIISKIITGPPPKELLKMSSEELQKQYWQEMIKLFGKELLNRLIKKRMIRSKLIGGPPD